LFRAPGFNQFPKDVCRKRMKDEAVGMANKEPIRMSQPSTNPTQNTESIDQSDSIAQ